MTHEPPREPPQSMVQATGQVASDVVGGLKNQPALLTVVVLNICAMVVAVWFLRELATNARDSRERLLQLVEECLKVNHTDNGKTSVPKTLQLPEVTINK